MPLGCRNIEPVCLGAHIVARESENDKKCALLTVANNAIVGALLQLSSLVRHADDLFCDISDECQKVFERTDKLTIRIKKIDVLVEKLDAKQAQVPEGDLKQFTAVPSHHEARHGYDASLFVPASRPQCMQDLYQLCMTNPTKVIRSADLYRKDGLSGSKMFKCWPVILNERSVRTPDLNLPRRVQRVRSFEKKYKQLKIRERPKTIHGWDDFALEDSKNEIAEKKNSNSEECLTQTEPPTVVSIDTSGSNFERMQSQRLSGRRYQTKEERDKKKKRRRTVSGVPENILHEIEKFDRKKKSSEGGPRQTPRSYSFDDLDAEDNDMDRDEGIMKYLDEIDGKMEERIGEEKAQKLMKYFPCKRSKSLPRCMKLPAVARSLSADRRTQRDLNTTYGSSCLSIHSMASNASSRLSRSTKRSSMIGNKLRSLVTGNAKDKPKPRPKSLDIDTFLDSKSSHRSSIEDHGRSKSTYSLERNHTLKVPDSLLHKNFSEKSESSVGPGSYYNFESSTLPRTQAKKYDFPWESLPKDWTTSVKLREISKRRAKEDRQSSSGNWSQSGTSSNRHSLDSDLRSEGYKFTSQYSLGKDSGRDSLTLEEENDCVTDTTSTAGYAADGNSTIAGSTDSVSIGNPKSNFTELDTETWIQSLAIRAAKREEAENADNSSTLSRLTKKNILALDLMMSEDNSRKITDEESSIYSVDQEGFYTSFHNDSGLKKSTNTLVDEDGDDYSPTKDSISICSAESVIHRPDFSDKFAGLRKGNSTSQAKVLSKVTPPAPPPRTSSTSSKDLVEDKNNPHHPELHSFPSRDSSISESDAEAVFSRVHDKTNLSSTGFPSLVALSTSDDESSPDSASDKFRCKNLNRKVDNYIFSETGSDLELSNINDTSGFSQFSYQTGSSVTVDGNILCSELSLKHSKSNLECTDHGYDSLTLPKSSNTNKTSGIQSEASYQSWPRSHKSNPTSGILKTPEKQFDGNRPQKSLNFAPVLNLFNHGAQDSVQVPLPSPTNSSSSEGNIFIPSSVSHTSSFQTSIYPDQSYQLALPIQDKANTKPKRNQQSSCKKNLPLKYQPVITVTPRSRSGDRSRGQGSNKERTETYKRNTTEVVNRTPIYSTSKIKPNAQLTPHASTQSSSSSSKTSPNLYAVSPVLASRDPSRQNSGSSQNSDTSMYMDMQSAGSLKSAGSSNSLASSDCLNFHEDSTYMSMASPSSSPNLSNMDFSMSSTPTGSLDSLLDMRKTPTNEIENDTYQVNTNLHLNKQNGVNSGRNRVDTVPIVTQEKNGNLSNLHENGSKMSFSSFRMPDTNSSYKSNMSSTSYSSTPGRRSLDSSDNDLTRVTQMSLNSTSSSFSSPVMPEMQSGKPQRQVERQSRADTRKEPSYRSHDVSNRRSLPSDMSGANAYTRGVPPNNTLQSAHSKQRNHQPQSMTSSRSYPSGFPGNSISKNVSDPSSQGLGISNSNGFQHSSASPNGDVNQGVCSSRSDSYRVATRTNNRNGSYRVAMNPSKSYPVLPPTKQSGPYRVAMDMSPSAKSYNNAYADEEVMSRADSYRIAVRNTNGIVPDIANRNSSYRVAISDDIPSMVNSKLDALSLDSRKSSSGRDARRMGITDVDQAKDISGRSGKDGRSSSSLSSQSAKSQQNGGRIRKVTKQDVDPIQIVQASVDNNNDSRKSNKNNQNRSSTYIQFDPIFEDTEDFTNTTECLRLASMSPDMDLSSHDYSLHLSNTSKSKLGLINGTTRDANANNVKVMKKSKSAKSIEIEDNWRFSQV